MKDLTTDNITANVIAINSVCPDPRLRYLFSRLVTHIHDFARETRLSTSEWMAGLLFLTAVGQKSTELRQEFILLSDTLGLSLLVDSIDHPKPDKSTEGTVLGPFHTHDAVEMEHGEAIHTDPDGTPCLVLCTVKDTEGRGIEGVRVDVWEGDSKGFYDVQYEGRDGPDGRALLKSDKEGGFWFKGIVPVPYPVPIDGPVGQMLKLLGRHAWRPGHLHFMFEKTGYDHLITALYLKDDPYESSDAVFGVKESLVVGMQEVTDEAMATKYGVQVGTKLFIYDFVLVSDKEAAELREKKAREAMEMHGRKMKFFNGLPVPDVD
jgi:protocatechuate 3,4-dioxygenase beta subunit